MNVGCMYAQVEQGEREEVLEALSVLMDSKLKPAQRAEVVLLQCRLQRQQCSSGESAVAVAPALLRAWMRTLPRALWELGPSWPAAARAALEVLRRGSLSREAGGEGKADGEGDILQELQPMLAANLGVVGVNRCLIPGPLLSMPEDVQVRTGLNL